MSERERESWNKDAEQCISDGERHNGSARMGTVQSDPSARYLDVHSEADRSESRGQASSVQVAEMLSSSTSIFRFCLVCMLVSLRMHTDSALDTILAPSHLASRFINT